MASGSTRPRISGGRKVNHKQRVALENHCRFAFETMNPAFHHLSDEGYSLIITVNSGYE